MDPVALGFYAVICGLLSLAAPSLGRPFLRLGIGALVGIIAAAVLPMLKSAMGL
ncbi:hypothetical protein [Aliiroseovarius sp.]|uniref:hypothetical protein n=1 Tax=Aliiroseovarius sp. TaxID=1872442 RepID=UPI003BA9BEE9